MRSFILSIFTLLLTSSLLFSQSYNMSNGGSASTCSGTFYDPGGTGNYTSGNSTWTYTICNPSAPAPIFIDFTSFNLRNPLLCSSDVLRIYNGPTTASPLIGTYTGTNNPGFVVGTTGCLTFQFQRYGTGIFCSSGGAPGWTATISCTPPSQTGDNCFGANAFCSSTAYNFQNNTSGSAPGGPNYGCLGSQPNPIWYYMEIDNSGPMQLALSQTTGPGGTGAAIDVDFAMWGPVTNLITGCSNVMNGTVAPLQCSFSASATETLGLGYTGGTGSGQSTPASAVAGQIYIVLLTNYNGSAGYITFNQSAGSGEADCSIILPMELATFTGSKDGRRNKLEWITTTEHNNSHFALERSSDGINWETIEIIEGSGNSSEMIGYVAYDDNFTEIENYYRLNQFDFDGKNKTSKVVVIDNSLNAKTLLKVVNTLGQEVDKDHPGMVLYVYDDGTVVKKMN